MKIIHEIAKASTKNSASSLAIRVAILAAVIMMGTLLFIYSELELSEWKYHQKMFGDFHAQLFDISESEYRQLQENEAIQTLGLSKGILLENLPFQRPEIDLYLQTPALLNTSFFIEARSLQGRLPQQADEILVSEIFVLENQGYTLGSTIRLGSSDYQISGIYKEHLYSFEKHYRFFGQLSFEHARVMDLFQNAGHVDATIWFQNERDTYRITRQILEELGKQDEDELLKMGGLLYNTRYLEGKLIFRSGLVPSSDFVERWSLRIGLLVCVAALFVMMIYNAFNVWSSQELRQIGLLKSSGMTPKQIRYLVREEALRISLRPILIGLVLAYGLTNLLFYLMWLNAKTSKFAYASTSAQLRLVTPNPLVFIALFLLAVLCVLAAAMKPARRSSMLSVIDAMKGSQAQQGRQKGQHGKQRWRLTDYGRNITRSLGKDNSISYKHTFRGMAIAMALAGMVFSTVLIVQSQRGLEEQYDTPSSPYTLTSTFFAVHKAPRELIEELKTIPNIGDSHVFTSYDFRYLPDENEEFISDELRSSLQDKTTARAHRPTVTVYGLEDLDFRALLARHGLDPEKHEGFLLLNQTAQNPHKAYKHRSYIPLSQDDATTLVVQDNKDKERYHLPIAGRINEFPFDLYPLWPNQIALFTSMTELEDFRLRYDKVDEYNSIVYGIKVAADLKVLPEVTEAVRETLHQYIPKSDAITRNHLSELANQKEQYRNELLLTISMQILFVVIGLSSAYNSVHMNLKARTRDFALLRSVGMTESQLKKMLGYEIFFLVRQVVGYYIFMLAAGVWALAAKKHYMFSPWQLALNLNFPLLLLFFVISILGIWAAMESGRRKVLRQSIMATLQENY